MATDGGGGMAGGVPSHITIEFSPSFAVWGGGFCSRGEETKVPSQGTKAKVCARTRTQQSIGFFVCHFFVLQNRKIEAKNDMHSNTEMILKY